MVGSARRRTVGLGGRRLGPGRGRCSRLRSLRLHRTHREGTELKHTDGRDATSTPYAWRKSTYSANQGDCVEVAPGFAGVPVRDSKDPSVGCLVVGASSWAALTAALRA
ncbi:DUF397 domain-containing protein [Embleya sp. NBC_00888]|uniref:DUF397 domain-containing protein n=1 Tax=Embleya sp. NBC_00888 TaxID=2975960 RepID=UPI00386B1D98